MIDIDANLGTGIIYTPSEVKELFPLLEDCGIEASRLTELKDTDHIPYEIVETIQGLVSGSLLVYISKDGVSGSIPERLVIAALSNRISLTLKDYVFAAFNVKELPKPKLEELEAFKLFSREPETIIWATID